jgi:GNAT superfamily N-acetyltransferase
VLRLLTLDDIPAILELAHKGAAEIPSWGEIDDVVFANTLSQWLAPTTLHYWCMGVFDGERFLGGMAGLISPTYFNKRWVSEGLTIYLHPDARGKGIARQLYAAFDQWVQSFDYVSKGNLRTTSGVDITPLVRPLGYECIGKTYSKEYAR